MKRQWENEELIEHWMLTAWDLAQLGNKTGATRLGFAVLLKFFQRLRMDPGRVGLATMLEEMAKLRLIRELKLPDILFPGLSRKVLTVYRNRASIEKPSRLRAHPKPLRLTLLAALCFLRAQEIQHVACECPQSLR